MADSFKADLSNPKPFVMGACLNSFFRYFTPFLAKSWPFSGSVQRGQICERKTFFTFPPDLEKSGGVGRPPPPDFFLRQIDFFPHFTA